MLRISLIVCLALIFGVTAKPHKPRNTDAAVQDTVVSIDGKGKMSWGVEVEPPEDLDQSDYDIDPRMLIWKSMAGGREGKLLQAGEDVNELHHQPTLDLHKLNTFTGVQSDSTQEDTSTRYDRPEEDLDDVDHPFPMMAPDNPEPDWDEVRETLRGYLAPLVAKTDSEPEEDEDDLFHQDSHSPGQSQQVAGEVRGETAVRIHLQPEEDMDDLYHPDHLQLIRYHDDADAAVPVHEPSQRKYNQPEEDEDDVYHRH